jgi:phenylacetate-CoA ligase
MDREAPGRYLMCNPGVLEQLAFYCGERAPPPTLAGMLSISGHLTAAMRSRLESTFGVPVHQNYGLNEVGIVAARCPAGRYHVHAEHCLVEILDEAGQQAAPGRPGRVIVTALQNYAMPLFRYDTDDVAVAASGTCPCGRTLPSFERIEGRYRRYAFLPSGTRQRVNACRTRSWARWRLGARSAALPGAPAPDGSPELRCSTKVRCPTSWFDMCWRHGRRTWWAGHPLTVRQVAAVARTPGGKHLEFTSEFNPVDPEMPAAAF